MADTVTNEKNLVDVTPNILSSVRVMEARDAGLQTFPSLDSLHLAEAARLEVPAEAVRGQAINGAVRMIMMMMMMMMMIKIMMMILIMMMLIVIMMQVRTMMMMIRIMIMMMMISQDHDDDDYDT